MNIKRNHSFLIKVQSREQLLLQDDKINELKFRRTKIICSVHDKNINYQTIKAMIQAGGNALSINAAYLKSRSELKKLVDIRHKLEQELNIKIPITLLLKGTVIRVGELSKPEIFLKANSIIRLTEEHKIIGDHNIIPIDQTNFFHSIKKGDVVGIDYGQVMLKVLDFETKDESIQKLMEIDPDKYAQLLDKDYLNHQSNPNSDSQEETPQRLKSVNSAPLMGEQFSQRKVKYVQQLRKYKSIKSTNKYKIVVCKVKQDCILRSYKPVFLCSRPNPEVYELIEYKDSEKIPEEDEYEESQITNKDINDIFQAKSLGIDSITISNVTKASQVKELRNHLANSNVQILVRITKVEGVKNFDSLLAEADGCVIARAYIAIQSPVEDVVKQQYDMIHSCRKQLKPAIICTQVIPTFTEMGDISNVVREYIDGIMLTGETTYGHNPIQVIQALNRVCKRVEFKYISDKIVHPTLRDHSYIYNSETPIASAIAQSAVETAYQVNAKLIMTFTTTGSTAIKISKLRAPCQTLALSSVQQVIRQLNFYNGITPQIFDQQYSTEEVLTQVTEKAKQKGWVQVGDYVVVISGSFNKLTGHINSMQVVQIN